MLKFGTPAIALPLAIKKCTVQTGCTVNNIQKKNKINTKIEDVGLTEDWKQKMVTNFHDKKNQNPTYCFSVLYLVQIALYNFNLILGAVKDATASHDHNTSIM